ncbi:MAG: hypothetical protein M3018_13145 [Actinomycetota bacterium]|nr:hypothetical protein [Actinomycetota bacterium]
MTESPRRSRVLLAATRLWLPVAIATAGVVLIVAGQARSGSGLNDSLAAVGVALIIAALIVWMINWMFRMSVESNRDREREEAAREYFTRHGRWPDEDRS